MSFAPWLRITVLFVSLVLTSCGKPAEPVTGVTDTVTLRVGLRPHLSFAPLKIAQVEGYFEEEGLDVELVDAWPADALVALPLGHLDAIGVPVFVGLFNAMEREPFVRVVADKGHIGEGCSPYVIMAREKLFADGPLEIDSVAGLRLEKRPGSIYDFIMEQFFDQNGIGWDDFEFVEWIPPHMSAAAFETGQIDLKIETEPNVSALAQTGLARPWIPLGKVVPGLQFSAIVYGPRLIEMEPELGIRFMKAYLKGVRQYNEGATARNVEIVAEFTKLDPGLVRKACWTPIDPKGMIDTDQVEMYLDWLREDDFVSGDLLVEDWWNPRFALEASRALGVEYQ